MLVQNPNDTIDKLIYYANRLMTGAKKFFPIVKTLVMIYDIKKLCHYMLGNNFMFFVDH
jgi:hypothetical protein